MAQAPSFIDCDEATILAETLADYEARTGRPLQPAQVETLILKTIAYRETLLRGQVQSAALQNLVDFSSAPILDYLGVLVGVTRLPAAAATVTVRFVMVTGHTGPTIPQGLRIASVDGQATFATRAATIVPLGAPYVDVDCICLQVGTIGNGYVAGAINSVIDPQPYIAQATANIIESQGGADLETDEALRARIKLAPASFSTAGSVGAYQFHARSANANIVDVAVVSPLNSGIVYLYPLMADGSATPPQILAAVEAACSGDRVRPVSDLVIAQSPTRLNYVLSVQLSIYANSDPVAIEAQVRSNLQAFTEDKRRKLGRDITLSQVIAQCQVPNVYSATLVGWSDIIVRATEYPFCTAISITINVSPND